MRIPTIPSELADIAQQTFDATEQAIRERAIALPFPKSKNLPWGVLTSPQPFPNFNVRGHI